MTIVYALNTARTGLTRYRQIRSGQSESPIIVLAYAAGVKHLIV